MREDDDVEVYAVCCAGKESEGCCCIGDNAKGCCCVDRGGESFCCVPPGYRGCCCCCVERKGVGGEQPVFVFHIKQLSEPKLRCVPSQLAVMGVTPSRWTAWMATLQRLMRENDAFYERPCAELAYWCCPLGPLQTMWCLANPHTHRITAKIGDAKEQAERMINADLAANGSEGYFQWSVGDLGM